MAKVAQEQHGFNNCFEELIYCVYEVVLISEI